MRDLGVMTDFNQIMDKNIDQFNRSTERYPMLHVAATPLAKPSAPITGRDMDELRRGLRNPEKANVILLGDPGSGKTAYVQGFTYDPESTQYLVLSVDIERFVKDSTGDKDTEMANGLLDFVGEVSQYSKDNDIIVILFIDEFHRISMVSPSAVEALKPILEKSAHNGFRIVAATTFEEYDEWIAPNRALDQRLLRITLPELPRDAVIEILKSRARQYGADAFATEEVYGEIYDISKQILVSNSQPRASIDILLNVIGNITKNERMSNGKLIREYASPEELGINADKALSRPMLNRVIQRSYGIDIDNRVSIPDVKEALWSKIYNQNTAVSKIISRLELALTGFNDPTRPKISFLSTGPTGVGKALDDETLVPILRNGKSYYEKHGNIQVGDFVFDRCGDPTLVTGVYPQGLKQVYEITFSDGRVVRSADEHLWTVYSQKHRKLRKPPINGKVLNTKDLVDKGVLLADGSSRFYVPNNHALELEEQDFTISPYLAGLQPEKLEDLSQYQFGSYHQRWDFVRGLFDRFGAIKDDDHGFEVTFKHDDEEILNLTQTVLNSLGYSTTIKRKLLPSRYTTLRLLVNNGEKYHFFKEPEKSAIAEKAKNYTLSRNKNYDYIGIKDIKILDEEVPMTCIMVDNEEHLYQLANGIVTHNTELAKVISEELGIPLKRFDMSRYPRPEDAVDFANQLAQAAWSAPNGYLLIDEVEKSSREAMNILLQVLDDARLTAANNPNRVISFTGNIINLTTNLASEVYQHQKKFGNADDAIDDELVYQALADSGVFETAVLGRIDVIVPFAPLPNEAMAMIAENELRFNLDIVETKDRPIFVSQDIIPYIVRDRTSKDTERGGARDAKRNIKNVVIQRLATYLADEPKEVPLILELHGQARFKTQNVGDPMSADVAVLECHSRKSVNKVLKSVADKFHSTFYNAGIFIPNTQSLKEFVSEVATLARDGYTIFRTEEYDEGSTTVRFLQGYTPQEYAKLQQTKKG